MGSSEPNFAPDACRKSWRNWTVKNLQILRVVIDRLNLAILWSTRWDRGQRPVVRIADNVIRSDLAWKGGEPQVTQDTVGDWARFWLGNWPDFNLISIWIIIVVSDTINRMYKIDRAPSRSLSPYRIVLHHSYTRRKSRLHKISLVNIWSISGRLTECAHDREIVSLQFFFSSLLSPAEIDSTYNFNVFQIRTQFVSSHRLSLSRMDLSCPNCLMQSVYYCTE